MQEVHISSIGILLPGEGRYRSMHVLVLFALADHEPLNPYVGWPLSFDSY